MPSDHTKEQIVKELQETFDHPEHRFSPEDAELALEIVERFQRGQKLPITSQSWVGEQDCETCGGHGSPITFRTEDAVYREGTCQDCEGTGKKPHPQLVSDQPLREALERIARGDVPGVEFAEPTDLLSEFAKEALDKAPQLVSDHALHRIHYLATSNYEDAAEMSKAIDQIAELSSAPQLVSVSLEEGQELERIAARIEGDPSAYLPDQDKKDAGLLRRIAANLNQPVPGTETAAVRRKGALLQTVTVIRAADRHAELHSREFAAAHEVAVASGDLGEVLGAAVESLPTLGSGRYTILVDWPHENGGGA